MKAYEEILKVKEKHADEILSYEGVHSVGIGYKRVNGEKTDELAILVFVADKKSIDEAEIIPNKIEEVAIEIIEMAPPQNLILSETDESEDIVNKDQGRYRPLIGGIQLYLRNDSGGWFGTLGTFVKSKDEDDDDLYVLSNLHVLESVGLAVYQPYKGNNNLIGATSFAEEFENTDAALAEINDPADVEVNTILDIGKVTEARDVTIEDLEKEVMKRGRTTLLTMGTILAINTVVSIGGKLIEDIVTVKTIDDNPFVRPGDSGSPAVLKDDNNLTGLIFAMAGEGEIGFFCKIGNVFTNLNVKLPD